MVHPEVRSCDWYLARPWGRARQPAGFKCSCRFRKPCASGPRSSQRPRAARGAQAPSGGRSVPPRFPAFPASRLLSSSPSLSSWPLKPKSGNLERPGVVQRARSWSQTAQRSNRCARAPFMEDEPVTATGMLCPQTPGSEVRGPSCGGCGGQCAPPGGP